MSNPIPQGGEINGVALFSFIGAPDRIADSPNTYTLKFSDVFGRNYELKFDTVVASAPPTTELPGVQQEIIPDKPISSPTSVVPSPMLNHLPNLRHLPRSLRHPAAIAGVVRNIL